jgi:hypothetical protein
MKSIMELEEEICEVCGHTRMLDPYEGMTPCDGKVRRGSGVCGHMPERWQDDENRCLCWSCEDAAYDIRNDKSEQRDWAESRGCR